MLRITLKGVRGHLLRFLLSGVAVALGVALMAGTFVLTDSINKTFDDLVDQGMVGIDAHVRGLKAGAANTGIEFEYREQLPLDLREDLEAVDGVERVLPALEGTALLVGKEGTPVRSGGAPSLGFGYFPDDEAIELTEGRAPQAAGEILVEQRTLKLSGLAVGDDTKALISGKPTDVTIVGEVVYDAPMAGATMVMLDEESATEAFAPDGKVSTFYIGAADGVSVSELLDRLKPVVPATAEVVSAKQAAEELKDDIGEVIKFITIAMVVFALISLFVGAFIIFNTFGMLVAQRTRELALLRAVGGSRGQLIGMLLGESIAVGLVGSLLGLLIGIGLGAGLQALMEFIGLEVSGGVPVLPRTIIVAVGAGVVVTVLGAVLPAIRAARIAPVQAMRDELPAPKSIRRRGLIGLAMMAVGIILLLGGVLPEDPRWLEMVAPGAQLLLIGSIAAAPLAARPVIRFVSWPFVKLRGTVGQMARENSLRNPRRTTVTAAALMIGLAFMVAVGVLASSTKASLADLVESELTADFVLNGGGQAVFPTEAIEAVEQQQGVESVVAINALSVQTEVDGGDRQLAALAADATGIAHNVRMDVLSGSVESLDAGQVLINETIAEDSGWQVGSTFEATVGTLRGKELTVGGVFADSQVIGAPLIVPEALYQESVPAAQRGAWAAYVNLEDGADVEQVRSSLNEAVKPFLVISVQNGEEFVSAQATGINQMLGVMYGLLALSVIIAVLGIVNTLALSVFERTREIGLLRAVGMTRRQLRRMVSIESIATAVFGAVLGIALGLFVGVAITRGLASQGLEEISVPWGQLVVFLILAAVAGFLAALWPARRAAKLNVLEAIATE